MRTPVNSNFEKLRDQAARQRLADIEAHAEDLARRLEEQTAESRRKAETLQDLVSDMKTALESGEAERMTALRARVDGLSDRLTQVDEAFSEPGRLRGAITPVLAGALRDAGQEDSARLSSALAPSVVGTIRTEILNSEDALIEAIHPRLGTLIAAAISNAIDELNRKVDEALPVDRWIAALKSRLTGAPAAGWLLESGRDFRVRDAMLIDRHSGVLLASERGTAEADAMDGDLMAGMIAALQGFASEAYGATGAGDLRRFSFTEDTVYLRGTPTKILALRCSGIAPPEIERRVDDLLAAALERLRKDGALPARILALEDLEPKSEPATVKGPSASAIAGWSLAAVAAVVVSIWGHGAVTAANADRWTAQVVEAARADDGLGPYPLSITRNDADETIVISGLLRDDAARLALLQRVNWAAVPVPVVYDIALIEDGS